MVLRGGASGLQAQELKRIPGENINAMFIFSPSLIETPEQACVNKPLFQVRRSAPPVLKVNSFKLWFECARASACECILPEYSSEIFA